MVFEPDIVARVRPSIRGLLPYRPGKLVEELERELGVTDAVKLASNENPRGPGPAVREAIRDAERDLARYPDGNGFTLKRTLAERLGVTPEQITLGNGSNDVLELLSRLFLSSGDRGIVDAHCFAVYPLAIASTGGEVVRVPSRDDYGHDLKAMAAAVDRDTRILYIANPNNPTGTRVTCDELETLLAQVPEDLAVVLDEAYGEYVELENHPDGLAFLQAHPNLIVTRTFSKIHGLAALRIGYAVSHAALADLLNRLRQPFNVNRLALAAAEAALDDQAYVSESRHLNDTGLAFLTSACEARQIPFIPSLGNFLMIHIGAQRGGEAKLDANDVYAALLREGVIVRRLADYGLPEFLRVTVGLPEENMRFIDALDRVCAGLKARADS